MKSTMLASCLHDTIAYMIELKHVSKSYQQGETSIPVLTDVSLTIQDGEHVAIVGASGSGKSTLLSLMSGMDSPDSGEVWIDGELVGTLPSRALSRLRNEKIGMIFQSFELVPAFTALENVMLPLDIRSVKAREAAARALDSVGLSHRHDHLPSMLSGGEAQRVAIARALAQEPKIIFADEPTGNLDPETGKSVLALITASTLSIRPTIVLITHDVAIGRSMDRILKLEHRSVTETTL
jgi:ABC-type lipoprotein export system ATPase subunit